MKSKKIVIAINTSWNIFNFRAGLVKALVAEGFEVVAVAPPDAHSARLAELGCRFVCLRMDNKGVSPTKDFALLARFRALLAKERPDAFLGYTIKPNVYGSLASHSLGIPTINNVSGLGTAFIHKSWLTLVVKLLYRAALRRAHTVFFQNDDDRNLFSKAGLVRAERTLLLPGSGINLQTFKPDAETASSDGSTRFLFVGRLLRDKGIFEFVEAARLVRRSNPGAAFQILGFLDVENRTAVTRETVEQWVAEGIVKYLGDTDDVRPFIANSDCVVLPSYREGTPRTLLEAAAMAKPLIATDAPGCREVVENGMNGFLCEVQSSDDLARRMIQFIALKSEERRQMGQASRLKVEREFDEQIVIRRYLDVLKELFERPSGRERQ